jgi:hypothetical protein
MMVAGTDLQLGKNLYFSSRLRLPDLYLQRASVCALTIIKCSKTKKPLSLTPVRKHHVFMGLDATPKGSGSGLTAYLHWFSHLAAEDFTQISAYVK